MTTSHTLKLGFGLTAALLLLPLHTQAAGDTKAQIDARYTQERAACQPMNGHARDVCREEAKGHERVSQAERVARGSGSAADAYKLRVARAEASYAVSRKRCDAHSGNAKDVCVQEAKSIERKALADAKLGQAVSEATHEATEAKREADYKLAAEKCESMAGDAKNHCRNAAKMQHRP